ncbi:MAG: hypothetical protein ABSG68_11395 [Thermoguttaceae bacterium]|jgi:hypothetical protein
MSNAYIWTGAVDGDLGKLGNYLDTDGNPIGPGHPLTTLPVAGDTVVSGTSPMQSNPPASGSTAADWNTIAAINGGTFNGALAPGPSLDGATVNGSIEFFSNTFIGNVALVTLNGPITFFPGASAAFEQVACNMPTITLPTTGAPSSVFYSASAMPLPGQVLKGVKVGDTVGTVTIRTLSGVGASEQTSITIVCGDDCTASDGEALDFTDPGTWPSLAGATVTLKVRRIADNNLQLTVAGTLVATSPAQILRFAPTHTATAAMAVAPASANRFELHCVLADASICTLTLDALGTKIGSCAVLPGET